jgi:hypothetical protein
MSEASDKEAYLKLLPEVAEALEVSGYKYHMEELLHEVARPYKAGWVDSEAQCLQRRTKQEFIRMFKIFKGETAFDLLGFRDEAEGLLCETAALECSSNWRFSDFYNRDKNRGKSGLGSLNDALQHYADNYDPNIYPQLFPPPNRGQQ